LHEFFKSIFADSTFGLMILILNFEIRKVKNEVIVLKKAVVLLLDIEKDNVKKFKSIFADSTFGLLDKPLLFIHRQFVFVMLFLFSAFEIRKVKNEVIVLKKAVVLLLDIEKDNVKKILGGK